MIIKIEDAPHIKHIKIDINFDDEEPNIEITNTKVPSSSSLSSLKSTQPKKSMMDDVKLDMDEDYGVEEVIVEKPKIPEHNRAVKVADDMESLEL